MRTTVSVSGIVLSTHPMRERGCSVRLLTDLLGLVWVRADGVLVSSSKLAPALSSMSYGSYILVRGKDGWRLRGALSEGNFFYEFRKKTREWRVLSELVLLLKATLHGEEHVEYFYNEFMALAVALRDPFTPLEDARLLAEARILAHLGFGDLSSLPPLSYDADTLRALFHSRRDVERQVISGRAAAQVMS